jgi:hypothetical protein
MATIKASLYFILFTISLINLSCESTRKSPILKPQYNDTQYKDIYLKQFKLVYFRELLIKSFNNSKAVQQIISNDHSGFTEPVLTEEDHKLIDSLTFRDNEILIADSAEGRLRAEGAQGKRPLEYIMEKLTSKWLDSLAIQRFRTSGIP